jgi:hypothetical protein
VEETRHTRSLFVVVFAAFVTHSFTDITDSN